MLPGNEKIVAREPNNSAKERNHYCVGLTWEPKVVAFVLGSYRFEVPCFGDSVDIFLFVVVLPVVIVSSGVVLEICPVVGVLIFAVDWYVADVLVDFDSVLATVSIMYSNCFDNVVCLTFNCKLDETQPSGCHFQGFFFFNINY